MDLQPREEDPSPSGPFQVFPSAGVASITRGTAEPQGKKNLNAQIFCSSGSYYKLFVRIWGVFCYLPKFLTLKSISAVMGGGGGR